MHEFFALVPLNLYTPISNYLFYFAICTESPERATIDISVFNKLIWCIIGPKELLIWHGAILSLGQMMQLIMIILSLTALTLC